MTGFEIDVRRALQAWRGLTLRIGKRTNAPLFGRARGAAALAGLTLSLPLAGSLAAQLSVPAAHLPHRAATAPAKAQLRSSPDAMRRTILLPSATAAEFARLRAPSANSDPNGKPKKSRGLAVGFARNVPASDSAIRFADLAWQTLPDDAQVARIELTSPGAAAIRIEVGLDRSIEGLTLRFKGSGDARIHSYPATVIVGHRTFWTPVLEGESAIIELELAPGTRAADAVLSLPRISHLGVPGTTYKSLSSYIGQSGACEVDVACMTPALQQQLDTATSAVARMIVTVSGTTYLCSGTLLNDSRSSLTPYLLTANHCVTGLVDTTGPGSVAAAAADSVNTYWFFQAANCGKRDVPDYTLLADGATLLARSVDYDWSLLRLNGSPPPGATFAAWNASGPLSVGTNVAAIHHPEGDLKKISQGSTFGYSFYQDGSSFIETRWASGATEPGSSGAGLFALNAANGNYELRGGLAGGAGTCSATGLDEFSRFDAAFPLVQEYVAPDAPNSAKTTSVTEFYSPTSDVYLITADPKESSALDNNEPQTWLRTGLRFLAFTDPAVAPISVQPVCRLRSTAGAGTDRLYSASVQECANILSSGNAWVLENAAAFYAALPDAMTGACPATTRPVYRFASSANSLRYRFTGEVDVRDSMIQRGGWVQEGFGDAPDKVAWCSPTTGPTTIGTPQSGANYEGLWWTAPESGWGLSMAQQGDTLFVGWFTYDASGKAWWLSMTASKTAPDTYSGLLMRTSGPPFDAVPFNPGDVVRTAVGAATLAFRDSANGTFSYAVAGLAESRPITRFAWGPMPTCTYGAQPNFVTASNYQDVWYVPAESGWGLMLTHQGDVIFVAWFTYGNDGTPVWLSATAQPTAQNRYSGTLIRTTGPPLGSVPFDPGQVTRETAGTLSLVFGNGDQATFSYSLDGITQSKSITRLLFAPPAGTLCQ